MRQLDLQPAFAAPGALREDVENELRAIEHLARKEVLQVAALRRRKFVVENDGRDLLVLERFLDQLGFAFADVKWRGRLRQFLRYGVDHVRARRARQLTQFLERIAQVPFRDAFFFESDEERALLFSVRLRFQSFKGRQKGHLLQDPIDGCCVILQQRQIQWFKARLPPKPGQLSFGIPAGRLLNRRDTLGGTGLSFQQSADLVEPKGLGSGRADLANRGDFLRNAIAKHFLHPPIDARVEFDAIAQNENTSALAKRRLPIATVARKPACLSARKSPAP